jgi:xylulokinase
MVSDIAGRAQLVPAITLGASYGDAFLAGLGTGLFESYSDISRWVRHLETVAPNPAPKPLYDRAHRIYRELYERTKDLMHDLTQEV